MANTTIIQKLTNGNVLITRDGKPYTLNPDSQCFKEVGLVLLKDKRSSLIDTYKVVDVEKVIREDGTEVLISDVDTLFSELINFFFLNQ